MNFYQHLQLYIYKLFKFVFYICYNYKIPSLSNNLQRFAFYKWARQSVSWRYKRIAWHTLSYTVKGT